LIGSSFSLWDSDPTSVSVAADDAKLMQQQMMMGGGGIIDAKKLYKAERENIDLVDHKWSVEDAEKRLLGARASK